MEIPSHYRTLYAQIEGTAADRRLLLSDKGLQLFRRRMHVLSGLHGVHSEQGSVHEKRIRVSRIVCGWIKAVLRAGCVGDAKSRLMRSNINTSVI